MSERIRGSYDDVLYKSTYTLLYFTLVSKSELTSCGKAVASNEPSSCFSSRV